MRRVRFILTISALLCCGAFAGCRGNPFGIGASQSQPPSSGNSSVVLAMTDTPPSTVTILSAQVMLTGATLMPGNVSVFSGSTTVDLIRLQTDIAYITTATGKPAGTYTGLTLTFANPKVTIENDSTSSIGSCTVGSICTIAPTSVANLSTTVPLSSFSLASGSTAGLLIDVSLDNLLSATLGADFKAGTTVTSFTPAGIGAPPVGAEDVVGQVAAVNMSSNTFTLTNATASYSLKVGSTSTFFQFPSSLCTTGGISCLGAGQILSVDIAIQSDGSIVARNIVFEDADSSDAEVEGMITSTNVGSAEFDIVIQSLSAPVTGLSIGQPITVQYTASPQTPFVIDFVHVDNVQLSASGFLFSMPADLAVGQQVSIRRNSASTSSLLKADRVLLRSSRITATVQTIGSANINLFDLPSLFSGHGVTQITARTSTFPATIYFEIGKTINANNIGVGELVSVRGPLFNVSGARTLLATKVVAKP